MKNKFEYKQYMAAREVQLSGKPFAWVSDGCAGYWCIIEPDTTAAEVAADFLLNYDGPKDFTPEVEIGKAISA